MDLAAGGKPLAALRICDPVVSATGSLLIPPRRVRLRRNREGVRILNRRCVMSFGDDRDAVQVIRFRVLVEPTAHRQIHMQKILGSERAQISRRVV
jgi:hypothetical protein